MTTESPAAMQILADENIPEETVALLRMAGHNILFIQEAMQGEADPDILALATREGRLLATRDKDFGDIVVSQNQPAPYGVVLFRLHNAIPVDDQFRLMAVILDAPSSWGPGIWTVSIRHPQTS